MHLDNCPGYKPRRVIKYDQRHPMNARRSSASSEELKSSKKQQIERIEEAKYVGPLPLNSVKAGLVKCGLCAGII